MKKTLYFIRHAESPFIPGMEAVRPLSAEGEAEAEKAASCLKGVKFDKFVSSPYVRAIQTLEPFKPDSIEIYEDLREKSLKGEYRLSPEEIDETISTSFEDPEHMLEGGESNNDVLNRVIPVIEELLASEYETIAIGTHGNMLTILINHYDKSFGFEQWKSMMKPDIFKLIFEDGKFLNCEHINYKEV